MVVVSQPATIASARTVAFQPERLPMFALFPFGPPVPPGLSRHARAGGAKEPTIQGLGGIAQESNRIPSSVEASYPVL